MIHVGITEVDFVKALGKIQFEGKLMDIHSDAELYIKIYKHRGKELVELSKTNESVRNILHTFKNTWSNWEDLLIDAVIELAEKGEN